MPPIELWGPATWTLFHVLAEKVNEHMYPRIAGQLFDVIKRICSALPCPECAQDATQFLAKIKVHELKSKNDFKNMIYMFHNYVNAKKRKPLFNYTNLVIYKRYNIVSVFNRFISFYHTKGNMRLLAESFQRQLIVRTVREWFNRNLCFFIPCYQPVPNVQEPTTVPSVETTVNEVIIDSETPFISPSDVLIEEHVLLIEEPSVKVIEEPQLEVIQEPVIQEPLVEVIEEPVIEEPVIEEPVIEEHVIEEHVIEEHVIEEIEEPVLEEPIVQVIPPLEHLTVPEVLPEVDEIVLPEVEATKPKRGRKKKTV